MTDLLPKLHDLLARQSGIRQAWVFGSVAAGRATYESDLDIAVEFDHPLDAATRIHLIEQLAETSGRPVDLIDLKTVGEPLLGQILQRGKRILGSSDAYAALLSRHLLDTADFMPYVHRMLRERKQAWLR